MKKQQLITELNKILTDLDKRYKMAEIINEREIDLKAKGESFDLRAKESAWGKKVAYGHSKRQIEKLLKEIS